MSASIFPLRPSWRYALPLIVMAWVFFLRAPSFSVTLWNVDESIHAAVAHRMIDGGLLYRDAIDQRTPLTYYVFKGVFTIFGSYNLAAVRALVTALIGGTACLLFLLGRRAIAPSTAWWALVIFVALSSNLLAPADAYAANTEWFAIFFTSAGACVLWLALRRSSPGLALGAGASFALAFLSKQPALLDALPPLIVIAYGAWTKHWTWQTAGRIAWFYVIGFLVVIALTLAHLAWRGGLAPAIFYTWSYNLNYYGPEISRLDRVLTALVPFQLMGKNYLWLLVVMVIALGVSAVRLVQFQPRTTEQSENPWLLYVFLWFVTSLAGATAGGRGFEHYYIQWLPAASLLAAWVLGLFTQAVMRGSKSPGLIRGAARATVVLLGVLALHLVIRPMGTRHAPVPPEDPAARASAFIRAHTRPDETIFVWGFNPDIYLYTQRPPASRFVYCSFLTGLIPWTNLAPEKDTRYAIVPGAMDQLLSDLERARPAFIVDCSVGPHRRFEKYPLAEFAPLSDYVTKNYVEVESAQFVPQGFRLHLIKDASRAAKTAVKESPVSGGAAPAPPRLFGDTAVSPTPTRLLVSTEDPGAQLQRLELWANDQLLDSVSFLPTARMTLGFLVPYDRLGVGSHRLKAIAHGMSGTVVESSVLPVTCDNSSVPSEQLATFALPLAAGAVEPLLVRAPFGPSTGWEEGRRMYSVHAPSVLSYRLGDVRQVRGEFGIRAGAYATENQGPTDGAEFAVTWIGPTEERRVLLRRLLRPRDQPADRGPQAFSLELPTHVRGARIEFSINPGPAGNTASDWTFWSNLMLEASR
jgi:4-amino-4-deoxy-L-arabinose transferase-like glycosyltransferase